MSDLTNAMHEDLEELLLRRVQMTEELDAIDVEVAATLDMIGMAEHMSEEIA